MGREGINVEGLDGIPEAISVEIVEYEGRLHLILSDVYSHKLARIEVMSGFPQQLLKHYNRLSAAGDY